jgi:hypothetical protein
VLAQRPPKRRIDFEGPAASGFGSTRRQQIIAMMPFQRAALWQTFLNRPLRIAPPRLVMIVGMHRKSGSFLCKFAQDRRRIPPPQYQPRTQFAQIGIE